MDFNKNDWDHMHDCIYHVTQRKSNQSELEDIFDDLPEELKEEAFEFGMNDTLWREHFIEWYEENI